MPAAPIRYPEVSQEIEGDSVSKSLGHVTYTPQYNRPVTYGMYSVKLKKCDGKRDPRRSEDHHRRRHELARESIRKMLESEPHLQVLAEAKNGQEVIELCRLQHADLVLMDVRMPKVNGFEATRIIKAELPTTKVLMLSAHFDSFFASEVKRAGADGYVTKLCTVQELVDGIRGVLRGESHYPSVSER